MKGLGDALDLLAVAIWALAGIAGLFLCCKVIYGIAGFWGIVVGILVPPVTLVAAPLYAVYAHGDWTPIVIVYGGAVAAIGTSALAGPLRRG